MLVEKQEVEMDSFRKCDDCGIELYEGQDIYYLGFNKTGSVVSLCEECINALKDMIWDEIY